MTRVGRGVAAGLVLAGVLVAVAACSDPGDLSFVNEGPDDVVVSVDGEEAQVDSGGGVVFLDNGCTDGDVTVTFPSGDEVVLPGPVCPDQEVVIGDGRADLRPVPDKG